MTSLSIAGAVPLNAKTVSGQATVGGTPTATSSAMDVSGSASGIGGQFFNAYVLAGGTSQAQFNDLPLITPQTLYYIATTGAASGVFGLLASAYTF